jgi:branched-chain amino acid aminotransferase
MIDTTIDFEVRPTATPVDDATRAAAVARPGFGAVFTDHMVTIRWSAAGGWHDARLEPFAPLVLSPATAVFHYAQAVFEGMKAYQQEGGGVALFRPEANAERFNRSAHRIAMPALPEDAFVRALELLVTQDRGWLPPGEGNSLYLRPFMIATQPGLGFTHPSDEYLFCVIASPAAAYFGAGAPQPITVWLSRDYSRAAPGGTGFAKTSGNYAGAFAAGRQATARGCDQVVWLDAAEHRWVEEMGGMNLFLGHGRPGADPYLTTPELTGTLLPGITRDSLLTLAPTLGIGTRQGRISVADWRAGCESGVLTEAFACGTAAVIAPIGAARGEDEAWTIGDGAPGPLTLTLRDELLGIQHGRRPDPFAWVHKVC